MKAAFWLNKWQTQNIGFHQDSVNAHLRRNWSNITPVADSVLVPLCGKSMDMLWLADQSLSVTGIELSSLAVEDFFANSQLKHSSKVVQEHTVYQSQAITVIQGDYFLVTPELTGSIGSFYDRAALIAMPESMQQSYVEKLANLLPTGAQGLLISIEYPQQEFPDPPPFSIDHGRLETLLSKFFSIELLDRVDALNSSEKFKGKVSWLYENVYKLTRI